MTTTLSIWWEELVRQALGYMGIPISVVAQHHPTLSSFLFLSSYSSSSSSSSGVLMIKDKQFQKDFQTFTYQEKQAKIEACLQQRPVPLWELRELALSKGGLLESKYRKEAWLYLVGLSMEDIDWTTNSAITSSSIKRLVTSQSQQKKKSSTPSRRANGTGSNGIVSTGNGNAITPLRSNSRRSSHQATTSSMMSNNNNNNKKKTPIDDSIDLILRDVGRSVIFRYPQPIPTALRRKVWPFTFQQVGVSLAQVLESVIRQQHKQEQQQRKEKQNQRKSSTLMASKLSSHGRSSTHGSGSSSNDHNATSSSTSTSSTMATTLHYYQGLHDVAGVLFFHLQWAPQPTQRILEKMSQSHLRDAMRENFGNITWLLSVLLLPLVEQVCPYIHSALVVTEVELSNICLPWIITWFTHDVYDPIVSGRLMDVFLSGHSLLPLYFSVALLTHPTLKKTLLDAADGSGSDDPAYMFALMKDLPKAIGADDISPPPTDVENENSYYMDMDDGDGSVTSSHGLVVTLIPEKVPIQELVEDAIGIMSKIPPRQLLDLVDSDIYSRSDLLQRVGSISMFKAPSSWSMASYAATKENATITPDTSITFSFANQTSSSYSQCPRAKLASGVPMLMATIPRLPPLLQLQYSTAAAASSSSSSSASNKHSTAAASSSSSSSSLTSLNSSKAKQQQFESNRAAITLSSAWGSQRYLQKRKRRRRKNPLRQLRLMLTEKIIGGKGKKRA